MWKTVFLLFTFGLGTWFLPHQKKKATNEVLPTVDAPTVAEGLKFGTLFGTLPSKTYVVDWFGTINYLPVYAKGQGKK